MLVDQALGQKRADYLSSTNQPDVLKFLASQAPYDVFHLVRYKGHVVAGGFHVLPVKYKRWFGWVGPLCLTVGQLVGLAAHNQGID